MVAKKVNPVEEVAEEVTPSPVEEETTETPVEVKEEKKNWKVTIKEENLKMFSLIKAPAEVKKIFDFYGITSQDVFDDTLKEKGLKADEIKTVKEWYATLI